MIVSSRSAAIAAMLALGSCLHVVQILDSVIIEKDQFLQLNNFNEANFVSQEEGAFNQTISVQITNNFENYFFDVFIFETDDSG